MAVRAAGGDAGGGRLGSRWRRSALRVAAAALAVWLAGGAGARGRTLEIESEYDVKAAFLLNFARFFEWPASSFEHPGSPFRIAVVGRDPFGASIDRIVAGKSIEGHPVIVVRMPWGPGLREAHIVFFSDSERKRTAEIPSLLKDCPALAVGDTGGFASHGGHVGFYLDQGRVRFEINPAAVKRSRLTVSSRLLALGKIVKDAR